jgi:hypothetical protein
MNLVFAALAGALMLQATATVTEQLQQEAAAMEPRVRTPLARAFLAAVPCLPPVAERTVWYNQETRDAVVPESMTALSPDTRAGYEETPVDGTFYYYTRYGTPVAFVRPLEILGRAGVTSADGLKIADFGFGSVGQLRALASLGAHATGIEVDRMLRAVYAQPGDTGEIARCEAAGKGAAGSVDLVFGHFPAEGAVTDRVGDGYDIFISKNTLKRGYIHPEQAVDPKRLVQLRVDDETFVRAIFDMLKPGGFALIYNLSPAPSKPDEPYKHWADGRSPWPQGLYERVGFAVIADDQDDTAAAREMGAALGWSEQMDVETDLFAVYTLVLMTR